MSGKLSISELFELVNVLGISSKLVSIYGRRAAIIASAKNVDFSDAWDILAETELESDDFYERIIQAERDALKKRFF